MRHVPTEEFAAFYHTYKRMILGQAYDVTRRRDAAEEVAQEVFLYAAKNFSKFHKMLPAQAGRYLSLAARSRALDWLRNEKECQWEQEMDIDYLGATVPGAEEIVLRQDTLRRAIESVAALPERYRTVLELYLGGFTPKELSSMLGLTEATVYKRLHRGFAKVRKEVAEDEE